MPQQLRIVLRPESNRPARVLIFLKRAWNSHRRHFMPVTEAETALALAAGVRQPIVMWNKAQADTLCVRNSH
jgi:hypothetical protein